MDVLSLLVVLLGWTALSCLVAVPVCLLLRGADVLEERARRTQERRRPRVHAARRPVRWCVHGPAGAVAVRQAGRRGR